MPEFASFEPRVRSRLEHRVAGTPACLGLGIVEHNRQGAAEFEHLLAPGNSQALTVEPFLRSLSGLGQLQVRRDRSTWAGTGRSVERVGPST